MLTMFGGIISSVLRGTAAKWVCYFVLTVDIVLSFALLNYLAVQNESITYMMGHFPAPWGNEIRFGMLEALMATFFSVIMLLIILGGKRHIYEDLDPKKINMYYIVVDMLMSALLCLVYTNDIFTAYVFVEIATISAGGLIMIREVGRTTVASVRYMMLSLLGSGLTLIGITLLYNLTGHLLMPNMHEALSELVRTGQYEIPILVTISLITIGLSLKSGLFPFHFWMPDTYGYSTPASGAILSGLVSKGYIFLLIKIYYRVVGMDVVQSTNILNVVYVFALLGMIVGSISAMRDDDIRRMIAFSSAAQIGYIFMGISLGTIGGLVAAIFHMLVHAVTKPVLFISASGLSDVSGGSKKFSALQGSGFRNRPAGIAFTIGALSMVGLPVMAGFVSKLLFATASLVNPNKMIGVLIVLAVSTVLNAVYYLRTVIRIYRPHPAPSLDFVCIGLRGQTVFVIAMIAFIMLNVFLGLASDPIIRTIEGGLAVFA